MNHIDRVKKMVVITNKWHMDRAKAIFEHVFALPDHHHSSLNSRLIDIHFETVDDGLDPKTLSSRSAREMESLHAFNALTKPKIGSMLELHNWLFREHGAYSANRHIKSKTKIDDSVLKSY